MQLPKRKVKLYIEQRHITTKTLRLMDAELPEANWNVKYQDSLIIPARKISAII